MRRGWQELNPCRPSQMTGPRFRGKFRLSPTTLATMIKGPLRPSRGEGPCCRFHAGVTALPIALRPLAASVTTEVAASDLSAADQSNSTECPRVSRYQVMHAAWGADGGFNCAGPGSTTQRTRRIQLPGSATQPPAARVRPQALVWLGGASNEARLRVGYSTPIQKCSKFGIKT